MASLTSTELRSNASGFNDVIQFANSGGTQNAAPIRARVKFDSYLVAPTISNAFNVDQIDDRGTGKFTIHFTNALTDANYAFSGNGDRGGDTDAIMASADTDGGTNTSGLLYIQYHDDGNNPRDGDFISLTVIR